MGSAYPVFAGIIGVDWVRLPVGVLVCLILVLQLVGPLGVSNQRKKSRVLGTGAGIKVPIGIKGRGKQCYRVHGSEGVKGYVAKKKKMKESIEANLKKLLKYNALSTGGPQFEVHMCKDVGIGSI
ncbi:hypothetical protein Tco_0099661 [Tanacetum coccineum]